MKNYFQNMLVVDEITAYQKGKLRLVLEVKLNGRLLRTFDQEDNCTRCHYYLMALEDVLGLKPVYLVNGLPYE